MKEKIQKILDEVVNVELSSHNGSAELSAYEDGVCWIKFRGACAGCMSASDTLDNVVKEEIMKRLPEVKDVRLDESVSQDMLDFARKILRKEIR